MEFVSNKTKDLSGFRKGKLIAIRPLISVKRGLLYRTYWLCKCDCGNEAVVLADRITGGRTQSCGCLLRGRKNNLKHGMMRTSEYSIWTQMRRRCSDPKISNYADYGGRGIRVCDRWVDPKNEGFENFLSDMGPRPSNDYSLDRWPDNNGPYSKENCRWATRTQQARNKRNNFIVTAFGKSAPLGEFVDDAAEYSRVKERIKAGWGHEHALTAPPRSYR